MFMDGRSGVAAARLPGGNYAHHDYGHVKTSIVKRHGRRCQRRAEQKTPPRRSLLINILSVTQLIDRCIYVGAPSARHTSRTASTNTQKAAGADGSINSTDDGSKRCRFSVVATRDWISIRE